MKRFLALLLVVCMMPIPAFADNAQDSLRRILGLGDEFVLTDNSQGVYQFSAPLESASAFLDLGGKLQSFTLQRYSYPAREKHLPDMTRREAVLTASRFVNRAAGDLLYNLDLASPEVNYVNNGANPGFQVRFIRVENGLLYKNNYVSILVSADRERVESFARQWDEGLVFEPLTNVIGFNAAYTWYRELVGLELRYNKTIGVSSSSIYPVYTMRSDSGINAKTGEKVELSAQLSQDSDVEAMYEKSLANTGIPLTQQELEQAEEEGAVLSPLQVRERLYAVAEYGITKAYQIEQATYYKDEYGTYFAELIFTNGKSRLKATVNASNGRLRSFFAENSTSGKVSAMPDDPYRAAYKFVDKYFTGLRESCMTPRLLYADDGYLVFFERRANGIPFRNNGVYLKYGNDNSLISMAYVWDNDGVPDLENILSVDEAYDAFFTNVGLELTYVSADGVTAKPLYIPRQNTSAMIDAVTGRALSYDGTPVVSVVQQKYTDLETHYAKNRIEQLAQYDIYIPGGEVSLNDCISQQDFVLLLCAVVPDSVQAFAGVESLSQTDRLESVYAYLTADGILEASQVAPYADVSREAAAGIFVKMLGYKEIGQLENIFQKAFADESDISPEYYGYVCLAKGLGIVGGSDGMFYPKNSITNGEALIMVYNYLTRSSK